MLLHVEQELTSNISVLEFINEFQIIIPFKRHKLS